jgi:hypothetical protein
VSHKLQKMRAKKGAEVTLDELLCVRLRRWKVAKTRQNFPHRPKDFVDVFPATATEEKLRQKMWWWRYADEENAERIFPPWGEGTNSMTQALLKSFCNYMEPSAFFYEFRARYDGRYKWDFGRPWIRCSDEQRRMLVEVVPSEYPSQFYLPVARPEDCWATISEKINLRVNDETLARQFLSRVAKEREYRGVKAPGKEGGVRRKKMSWAPIEYMDLRHYGVIKDSSSGHSQVSKARRNYEATCASLNLAP